MYIDLWASLGVMVIQNLKESLHTVDGSKKFMYCTALTSHLPSYQTVLLLTLLAPSVQKCRDLIGKQLLYILQADLSYISI